MNPYQKSIINTSFGRFILVADHSLSQLWQKLSSVVRDFNLFPSTTPSTDEHQLHNQRISTRIFIILLTVSLTVLILYTSLINVTQTIHTISPTISQYSQLYSTYPQTLSCACTDISIEYDKFLQVNYKLHQICTSVFVTDYWIDYFNNARPLSILNGDDFRASGSFMFQALNTFCQLSNQTIYNRLIQFYSTQYVSASVTPLQVLQSQTQAFVSQFISSMTNDFLLSISTIRKTTQTTCSYEFPIYNPTRSYVTFTVPGVYVGCYIIEALLQSNLQCFYNETCINQIQSYFTKYLSMNLTTLDTSLLVRFHMNSTIEELVDGLMVEEWNSSTIYDGYYSECQPSKCSYSYETKNSVIYIITTLIGLVGGLIPVLKLAVPRAVRLVVFYIQRRTVKRNAVLPFIEG
ncbi:unnamed protein product [Adineta steineri]|uniref:Transmembrane protein n=1 Tax=Adineta steineri TaxID=433720 RepID=A0A814VG46_9BILA|nr:unnamed protein product [Adineta steineri]CAF1190249.1 unnamed protein product [Adineta steineri]